MNRMTLMQSVITSIGLFLGVFVICILLHLSSYGDIIISFVINLKPTAKNTLVADGSADQNKNQKLDVDVKWIHRFVALAIMELIFGVGLFFILMASGALDVIWHILMSPVQLRPTGCDAFVLDALDGNMNIP